MVTIKEASEAIHCFYNEDDNAWCEYKYDKLAGMYLYTIYSEDGPSYSGQIGIEAIMNKRDSWTFMGVL